MGVRTVHAVCPHDCYDTCGLSVTVEEDRIIRIAGDASHPITRGFLCFKVNRYQDRLYHADRITQPLKRVGPKGTAQFKAVAWQDALDEVGATLRTIIEESTGEAILPYSFSGNMGILSEASMDRRFFHAVGASQLDRTICTASASAALRWVYGTQLGPDPETLPQTHMVVLWGTNPMATNVHEIPLLDEARSHGAKIWCVDPLNTATASRYDYHVALKPNTDYPLALGLGRAILERGAQDRQFIARYTTGFQAYERVVQEWTRERTLAVTGIPPEIFDEWVDQMIHRRPLLFRTGYGVQRQVDGAKTIWAISCLSLLLGTPQEVGGGHLVGNGGAFGIDWDRLGRPDLMSSSPRTVNMLQLGHALLDLDNPPIRALIVYNSNPAVTAPDQHRVLMGLRRTDLMTIVHEQMMTDTARYADWVFPAAMSMETLDLHTSYWHRYVQLSQPATPPWGESVSNTEFFRRLAQAVGLRHAALRSSDAELLREALDTRHPWMEGITVESLYAHPVQKVALPADARPFLDTPIPTPDGRFHLEPLPVDPNPVPQANRRPDELHLISPSRRETIKSSFGNIASVVKEARPEILMHPEDLARLGVASGEWVTVFNEQGETRMVAQESRVPQPGTAVSYAVRWNAAAEGTNVNQLTSETLSDYGGGGTFYSTRIRVRR